MSKNNLPPEIPSQQVNYSAPPVNNPYNYYPYSQLPADDEIDLYQLLVTLVKYSWLILIIVVISTFFTNRYIAKMPSIYEARAVVFLPTKTTSSSAFSALSSLGMASILGGDSAPADMIMKLLKSRRNALDNINAFNLIPYYQGIVDNHTFSRILGISQTDSEKIHEILKAEKLLNQDNYVTRKFKPKDKSLLLNLPPEQRKYKKSIIKILDGANAYHYPLTPEKFLRDLLPKKSNDTISQRKTQDPEDIAENQNILRERTISLFQDNFVIKSDKSSFITITYDDLNPQLAVDLINFSIINLDNINNELELTSQKPMVIVLESAVKPVHPIKPNKKTLRLICLTSSFIFSVFLIFLIEFILNVYKEILKRNKQNLAK